MAFKDLFKKKYKANCWCNNCNMHQEVQIPLGVTLLQYVESGYCGNCGCNTLVADYKQIKEFAEPLPKQRPAGIQFLYKPLRPAQKDVRRSDIRPSREYDVRPKRQQVVEEPQRAPIPPPRPSNRPIDSFPKPKPPEPDLGPKRVFADMDNMEYWLGGKKRG